MSGPIVHEIGSLFSISKQFNSYNSSYYNLFWFMNTFHVNAQITLAELLMFCLPLIVQSP